MQQIQKLNDFKFVKTQKTSLKTFLWEKAVKTFSKISNFFMKPKLKLCVIFSFQRAIKILLSRAKTYKIQNNNYKTEAE